MIPKGGDLGAVFAFMTVAGVHEKVIKGIVHAIPGKSAGLTPRFYRNLGQRCHDLGVSIVVLGQYFLDGFLFAGFHLALCGIAAKGQFAAKSLIRLLR